MRLAQPDCVYVVLTLLIAIAWSGSASAGVINGDFATGGLTGWNASAIDGLGGAATPLISVGSPGGNQLAVFHTGDFATGPFISTLEQSFVVDPAKPFLSFDFSGPFTSADMSGTGASPFLDAFAVSLESGGNFYDLLLLDQTGALADPFGTAPGAVALGVPMTSNLAMTFSADLSSLAGHAVTLFADLVNQDDAVQSSVQFDNVVLQDELVKKSVIPEPASLTLWSLTLATIAAANFRRTAHSSSSIVANRTEVIAHRLRYAALAQAIADDWGSLASLSNCQPNTIKRCSPEQY